MDFYRGSVRNAEPHILKDLGAMKVVLERDFMSKI